MVHQASSLRGQMRALGRNQKGVAALEFLLVLPFFVAFFLLAIDFGMLMYQHVSVANAVREGARFGSVNCGDGSCTLNDIKQRTIARSSGVLTVGSPNDIWAVAWVDNTTPPNGVGTRGDSIVVKVTHPYNFIFVPGANFDVISCADMSLEQTDSGSVPEGVSC